jgi:hypothetical protein
LLHFNKRFWYISAAFVGQDFFKFVADNSFGLCGREKLIKNNNVIMVGVLIF